MNDVHQIYACSAGSLQAFSLQCRLIPNLINKFGYDHFFFQRLLCILAEADFDPVIGVSYPPCQIGVVGFVDGNAPFRALALAILG
jgi:hypothetical protein